MMYVDVIIFDVTVFVLLLVIIHAFVAVYVVLIYVLHLFGNPSLKTSLYDRGISF